MKKAVLFICLTLLISFVSFQFYWFNYLLLVCIGFSLTLLLIIGLISIFKKPDQKLIKTPLLIILICLISVAVSLFNPYKIAIKESGTISERLEYAYKTDQNDRKRLKSYITGYRELKKRDSVRLKLAKQLYKKGKISKPIDKFYAAFIYHHSDNSKDYKIASILAADAAKAESLEDNYNVQWLRKASFDRWMLSIGKPEKYNTQNRFNIELE